MAEIPEAYWILKQLHAGKTPPDCFLNFRCIRNHAPVAHETTGRPISKSEVVFDDFIRVMDFKQKWPLLYNHLLALNANDSPANCYFAVNPLFIQGHKKESFAGFVAFYLDLDDNKKYTKEQRWAQIYYWTLMGFAPSFVIDSGHGYHAYWVLKAILDAAAGEALLKRMVALSGCKDKGNTFDISRVLRLPGFRNVKEWYTNNIPPCGLVYPQNWRETETVVQYDAAYFENFPPSELQDLQRYYNQASLLPGALEENIRKIIEAAREVSKQMAVAQSAQKVAQEINDEHASLENQVKLKEEFEPTRVVVPDAPDLKWPKGCAWMKNYCIKGYSGLTRGEIDELATKLNMQDSSASAFDFKIMYTLIRRGFTKEAIRDFWMRPVHRLHRPEKEAKNPNYFDMTHERAFAYAKAAFEENKKADIPVQNIVYVENNQMWMQTGEDSALQILTGKLELKKIYIDVDAAAESEREWYDIAATCNDVASESGFTSYDFFVPRTAFKNVSAFKDQTSDLLCVLTDKNAAMQSLLAYLLASNRGAPRVPFHSRLMYQNEKYVFPTFTVDKHEIQISSSNVIVKKLSTHLPVLKNFIAKIEPKERVLEQLQKHWHNTLKMHLPRVVSSILGAIGAAAIQPRFEEDLGLETWHLPTVNVRGSSTTAKTETVKFLISMTGMLTGGKNSPVYSVHTSTFALQKLVNMSNFLPIVIDEFKEAPDSNVSRRLAEIRDMVRRIYTGETIVKGRPDLSVTQTTIHGGMIIIGEHAVERLGDISEVSRIIPIDTSEYAPDKNREHFEALGAHRWYALTPYFYQHVLNLDVAALHAQFLTLKAQADAKLSTAFAGERVRVAHNVAALWLGCRIIDSFVKSMDASLPTIEDTCNPTVCLVEYLCAWAIENGHSIRLEPSNGNGKHAPGHVFSQNEFFAALKMFGELLDQDYPLVREHIAKGGFIYLQNEADDQLYLNLNALKDILNEYSLKTRTLIYISARKNLDIIKTAIKLKEPWVSGDNGVRRIGGKTHRCCILKLSVLQDMNIWPRALPTEVIATVPKNRIADLSDHGPLEN